MIYITGDTHGTNNVQKLYSFAMSMSGLTKEDYLIIAGDFGAVWNEQTLEDNLRFYSSLPFTVLFVDGNHENFDLLNSYPVETWNGGKVHKIKPDIIHLMRGQVFGIEGKTIFTFGGATSIDREWRTEGKSWWKQEVPTREELAEGLANLERYGNKVDYIVTHSCSERALAYPAMRNDVGIKLNCPEVGLLSYIEDKTDFKHWYFGHFHVDREIGGRYTALYYNVTELT